MGELHLDVVKNRMIREFKVEANFGKPRVSYRETLTAAAAGRGEFARALGTQQLWAEVVVRIEPNPGTRRAVAKSALSEGTVPQALLQGILESLVNSAEGGGLYGYPLIEVAITLESARYEDTGSAEIALNAAAGAAIRASLRHGSASVLEPIMRLEVRTPEEYLGAVMKNLGSRRATVEETRFTGTSVLVHGSVPLAEMFGYSTALRSLSQGRASFNLEPLDYRPVPESLVATFHQKL